MTDITKLKIYTYVKLAEMHILALDLVGKETCQSKIELLFSNLANEIKDEFILEGVESIEKNILEFFKAKIEQNEKIAMENKLALFLQKYAE